MPNCHQFISNTYEQRIAKYLFFPLGLYALGIMLMQTEYVSTTSFPVCAGIRHILVSCLLHSSYTPFWRHRGEAQAWSFCHSLSILVRGAGTYHVWLCLLLLN